MQLLARINAGGTTVLMATHEAAFVDQMQRRVIELRDGEMVRDEVGGGYGDRSNVPVLEPEAIKGAAATAALTAVLEVQRQTAAENATGAVPVPAEQAPPVEPAAEGRSAPAGQAAPAPDQAVSAPEQ